MTPQGAIDAAAAVALGGILTALGFVLSTRTSGCEAGTPAAEVAVKPVPSATTPTPEPTVVYVPTPTLDAAEVRRIVREEERKSEAARRKQEADSYERWHKYVCGPEVGATYTQRKIWDCD